MRWTRTPCVVVAVAAALVAGCKGEDPSTFSITAESNDATLLQGSTGSIVLNIARTNFDKPVDLTLEGTLPAGVTASFSQNPIQPSQPTVTLTFLVAGIATPGMASLTVKASAEGATEQTIPVTLTVNLRGSHTLSLSSGSMTVAQGGGGSATVYVNRLGSNAGNVTLTASSTSSGITAAFGQSPTTATTTSIAVAADANVSPGTYDVTVTGAQTGVTPTPQVTLSVTVVSAPATTSVSLAFCAGAVPSWFAYQNSGFNWKQIEPTGNSFTFAATDKIGIAYAVVSGASSLVAIYYATQQELVASTNTLDCDGSRNLTGTVTNVTEAQIALVAMGPRLEEVVANAYTMDLLPARALDLVAVRGSVSNGLLTPDRMIVRRALTLGSGALPVLDFQGSESFQPSVNTLTIGGPAASEGLYVQNDFWGATASYGPLFSSVPTSAQVTMYAVPGAQQIGGDVHQLYVDAFDPAARTARSAFTFFSTPGDRTVTLPALLAAPSITVTAASPYVRLRGQMESQAAYPTMVRFRYGQGSAGASREVRVHMTTGYVGSTPTTWDVTVPEMSGANGFNTAWMLTTGTVVYVVEAFSGRSEMVLGGSPVVGDVLNIGYRDGSLNATAPTSPSLRASALTTTPWPRRARYSARPQYFRR